MCTWGIDRSRRKELDQPPMALDDVCWIGMVSSDNTSTKDIKNHFNLDWKGGLQLRQKDRTNKIRPKNKFFGVFFVSFWVVAL